MTYVEMKEEALKGKIIPQTKREDFEAFWQKAVADMRAVPLPRRPKPSFARQALSAVSKIFIR